MENMLRPFLVNYIFGVIIVLHLCGADTIAQCNPADNVATGKLTQSSASDVWQEKDLAVDNDTNTPSLLKFLHDGETDNSICWITIDLQNNTEITNVAVLFSLLMTGNASLTDDNFEIELSISDEDDAEVSITLNPEPANDKYLARRTFDNPLSGTVVQIKFFSKVPMSDRIWISLYDVCLGKGDAVVQTTRIGIMSSVTSKANDCCLVLHPFTQEHCRLGCNSGHVKKIYGCNIGHQQGKQDVTLDTKSAKSGCNIGHNKFSIWTNIRH